MNKIDYDRENLILKKRIEDEIDSVELEYIKLNNKINKKLGKRIDKLKYKNPKSRFFRYTNKKIQKKYKEANVWLSSIQDYSKELKKTLYRLYLKQDEKITRKENYIRIFTTKIENLKNEINDAKLRENERKNKIEQKIDDAKEKMSSDYYENYKFEYYFEKNWEETNKFRENFEKYKKIEQEYKNKLVEGKNDLENYKNKISTEHYKKIRYLMALELFKKIPNMRPYYLSKIKSKKHLDVNKFRC